MTSGSENIEDTGKLLLLARSGDPGAVHELLVRYHQPLEEYIRRQRGLELALKESSSDLVQSVCREVLEDLAVGAFQYRGEAEFRQWLYVAALNKVRMRGRHWHADRRDADREAGPDDSQDPPGPVVTETPSRAMAEREQEERLRSALQRLPADQRRIIEWARFDGLSHCEIGDRLGVTEGNSRVLLARAMAQLAKLVAG